MTNLQAGTMILKILDDNAGNEDFDVERYTIFGVSFKKEKSGLRQKKSPFHTSITESITSRAVI